LLQRGEGQLAAHAALLLLTNITTITLSAAVVFLMSGLTPKAGADRIGHRMRLGLATALVGVAAVAYPLALASTDLITREKEQSMLQAQVTRWLAGRNTQLQEIEVGETDRFRVVVDLTGSDRPPVPQPQPSPAALVALAWVHLEHNELRQAHSRLKQADAALGVTPDKLIGAVAWLAAAYGGLAQGRAAVTAKILARARSGWPVPAWLEQRLSLVESWAYAAAGDTQAALAAAGRSGPETSPEAAVTLARAWVAAGDAENATRALTPVLATGTRAPGRVRLQAWLVDAQLSYHRGDRARGRTSLASALRLAEPEQLRLPFVIEHGWIEPVLRRDPELARAHRRMVATTLSGGHLPARPGSPDQGPILAVEPLSEREREVLRHVSGLLSTAEAASEMHISVNTLKTHLKHIYRKLATTRRSEAVRRARQLEMI